jgi:MFS family permease
LVATAFLLAATAFAITEAWICVDRFLSGAASAVVMVMASTWLFQIVGTRAAPLLYSGAGLGIVAAGESVAMLSRHGASEESAWLTLALTAGALMLPPLAALMTDRFAARAPDLASSERPDINPRRLVIVYAAGGFGYIISATYLPALVAHGTYHLNPVHVFSFFGLCAVPSCFIWLRLDAKVGTRRALGMNYCIQVLGTVLPMVSSHPAALLIATAAVGGTFMGVVAMAMAAGRRHASDLEYNLMAVLTAAYALGQAVGPAASAWVSGPVINLNASLGLAALILLTSIVTALAPDRAAAEARVVQT